MNRHLAEALLGLALVFGLAVQGHAQSSAPSGTPPQQIQPSQPSQGDASKDATPPTQQPEAKQPSQDSKSSTDVRVESRTDQGAPQGSQGRILGVDPTMAMVIGAVLLIVIVIALVAMARRTEPEEHHHRV